MYCTPSVTGVLAHQIFGVYCTPSVTGVLAHHRCASDLVCTAHHCFYSVHKRRPKVDEKFRSAITKQDIDWFTATLEDVEKFRNDLCSELSLQKVSLQLAVVAQGCVEITWLVPPSLVAYILETMKLSSPTMRSHHVSKLTIDGFIVYDSTIGI